MSPITNFLAGLALLLPGGGAEPHTLVVAVVDTSGSMAVEQRLETAVREIKQLARQLPPSPRNHWVMIPFHHEVYATRRFQRDLDELVSYVDTLEARGGTRIAAGLAAAIEQVEQSGDVPHVVILLYTDGEDNDPASVRRQEDRLAQMFDYRTERGLGQTLICRRWGRANAALIARFQQQPGVRVIDAGEARLHSVVLQPAIECVEARWSAEHPGYVELKMRATVAARLPATVQLPHLQFRCLSEGVEGEVNVEVPVNVSNGREFTCRLKVPLRPIPEQIDLEFDVQPPDAQQLGNTLLTPSLAQHRLTVAVDIPQLVLKNVIKPSVSLAGPAQWLDPARWTATVPLALRLEVASNPGLPETAKVRYRIEPLDSMWLDEPEPFSVGGGGEYTFQFAATVTMEHDGGGARATTARMELVVDRLPPGVLVDPERLPLEVEVPPPPPAVTRVTAEQIDVSRDARWIRLAESLAVFEARVRVVADGPLGENTELALVAPPRVRQLQLRPATIRRGEQVVTLVASAELDPSKVNQLVFGLQPAGRQGAVEIRCPEPLKLSITGPRPARVALAGSQGLRPTYELPVRDLSQAQRWDAVVVLAGASPQAAEGLLLRTASRGRVKVESPQLAPAQPAVLRLTASDIGGGSFFRDRRVHAEVVCQPLHPKGAVQGFTQTIVLRQDAPFKRLLFWAALTALGLAVAIVPFRFFWAVYQSR